MVSYLEYLYTIFMKKERKLLLFLSGISTLHHHDFITYFHVQIHQLDPDIYLE